MSDSRFDLEIQITHLRAQNNGSEIAVTVEISAGEELEKRVLVLSVEDYYLQKPQKGKITQEMFDAMEQAASEYSAWRCGVNLLSYGSNSPGNLRQKLRRHGFSAEESEKAVKKLSQSGILNESADLAREVEKGVKKLWGERRIRAQIYSKGYSQNCLAELESLLSKYNFTENCRLYLQKKYREIPKDRQEYQKMMASAYRYGYTPEEMKTASQMLAQEKKKSNSDDTGL